MKIDLPSILAGRINDCEIKILQELIMFLKNIDGVDSIFLTGSNIKETVDIYSDVDICIVAEYSDEVCVKFQEKIQKYSFELILDQGYYPWLGKTITITMFKNTLQFYDFGFIEKNELEKTFWDMECIALYDPNNTIEKLLDKFNDSPSISKRHIPNPDSNKITISFIKINKYLHRNNLWAAINSLNQLRYFLMLYYRLKILKDKDFKGRVEKNFEKKVSLKINQVFVDSLPVYDKKELASKSLKLLSLAKDIMQNKDGDHQDLVLNWLFSENNLIVKSLKESAI